MQQYQYKISIPHFITIFLKTELILTKRKGLYIGLQIFLQVLVIPILNLEF